MSILQYDSDILNNVLSFLPVIDLLRLRSVCRSWNEHIRRLLRSQKCLYISVRSDQYLLRWGSTLFRETQKQYTLEIHQSRNQSRLPETLYQTLSHFTDLEKIFFIQLSFNTGDLMRLLTPNSVKLRSIGFISCSFVDQNENDKFLSLLQNLNHVVQIGCFTYANVSQKIRCKEFDTNWPWCLNNYDSKYLTKLRFSGQWHDSRAGIIGSSIGPATEFLCKLTELTHLTLYGVAMSQYDLSILSDSLDKLRSLELEVCENSVLTREVGDVIGQFKSLDSFGFLHRRCGKNPGRFDEILNGLIDKKGSKMKCFNIGYCYVSDETLQNIVLRCQNLISFQWMLPEHLSDNHVLLLTSMDNLEELTLSFVEKDDVDILSQCLATMTRLRKLIMYSFQIPSCSSECLTHKKDYIYQREGVSVMNTRCICYNLIQMRKRVTDEIKIYLRHQSKYCEYSGTLEDIDYKEMH
ncbi:uncharacterized protein LOC141853841 [Brevipalpus obovatus]|uniref:uncharacterized protein LOC141853841 n=1 Tax=Brevipalpus obovatus TaxID=246614 RepID=UPI003D9E4041